MRSMWQILVPTEMENDHGQVRPIRVRFHKVWDAKVREITGGLTVLKPGKGNWVNPKGNLFVERMIPVMIVATLTQIQRIAEMTAKYYKQEAVLYYRVSDEVYFYNRDSKVHER
jgi:hypothetical protein